MSILQKHYEVVRNGEEVWVPIEQLTDVELVALAGHFKAKATGVIEEAGQLRRYVAKRSIKAVK